MLNRYVYQKNKKLRCGYTTGSCAAAAAKAATQMLVSDRDIKTVSIQTPKGIDLVLPVTDIEKKEHAISCAVIKDAGDDIDVTDGIKIYATVEKSQRPLHESKRNIVICGGIGVGVVTKKGLSQEIGQSAINPVPMQMIRQEVEKVLEDAEFYGEVMVTIAVPKGAEIAKKTFNPRLGIEGGISILGTSGIVEPMSDSAIVETIRAEISMLTALEETVLFAAPGNFGEAFATESLALDQKKCIKCSNFIGETIDMAYEFQLKGLLLIGHIGKMVKLGAGIMNTHSKWADGRMETLAASALKAGVSNAILKQLFECITTDEALKLLYDHQLLLSTMEELMLKIEEHLQHRAYDGLQIGAIVFSNSYGLLGKTKQADTLLKKLGREK